MITYTIKDTTEDEEETTIVTSDDPQIVLNAIEFFKKKINK